MAFDAFLKIDDIPGESKDSKHADWIEIIDFVHSVSQPVSSTASSAGGAATERANFSTINISKLVDMASPKLYEACFTGKHIKEVIIEVFRAGGEKEKYLEIKMEQVLIAYFEQGGGENFPVERVSFAPGKINMIYSRQKREDGTGGGSVATGWDLRANKQI